MFCKLSDQKWLVKKFGKWTDPAIRVIIISKMWMVLVG